MTAQRDRAAELFRSALMKTHSQDWTMEEISEAAHVCSGALADAAPGEAEWHLAPDANTGEMLPFKGPPTHSRHRPLYDHACQQPSPPPSGRHLTEDERRRMRGAFWDSVEVVSEGPSDALREALNEAQEKWTAGKHSAAWRQLRAAAILAAPSAGSAGQADGCRIALSEIIDIWDDGRLPHEQRTYLDGAFGNAIESARIELESRPEAQAVDQQARRHEKLLIACRDAMKISRGNTDWRHMIAAIDAALAHPETPK